MDETRERLEREYCPPLDPALFSAIISDYDLCDTSALRNAQATLESIKLSALETDASSFDPSGTTGPDDVALSAREGSNPEESGVTSDATNVTSISNGVSNLSIGEDDRGLGVYMDLVDRSDDSTKLDVLKTMFPSATDYNVSFTMAKCKGDFTRAMDELLNQCFISEGGLDGEHATASKSVDAFSEDGTRRRAKRKGDRKKNKFRSLDEARIESGPAPTSPSSPWVTSAKDVEFVCMRTNIASATVASLYHQHSGSLAGTIRALLTSPSAVHAPKPDNETTHQQNKAELGKDFPGLADEQLSALLRLTSPSTAAAHELAKAMSLRPTPGRIEVIPRYAPVQVDADAAESSWATVPSPRRSAAASSAPTSQDAAALASSYAAASSRAYSQAGAAYRRGKSDHLMGAAAGYYSQVGRDLAMMSKEATAEAADDLVARQSTARQVDLHGVSVKDAVRIARQRTDAWWRVHKRRTMGVDGRVRAEEDGTSGSSGQLTIVTGMGRHSRGGKGLIGPAVGRMLMQEGWEVQAGEGYWTVLGKR